MSRIKIARADYGRADALERAIDRASRKRSIEDAVLAERKRCAQIARFAEGFATTDLSSGTARAIAEAIENDAIGPTSQDGSKG